MEVEEVKKVIKNISNENFEDVIVAIDYFSSLSDFNLIKKIVEDKRFRPKNLEDQCKVLLHISGLVDLDLSYRLFGLVAAGHKAMESENKLLCKRVVPSLYFSFTQVDYVPRSDHIRKDSLHLRYSIHSVLWHIHLYLNEIDKCFESVIEAVDFYKKIDKSTFGVGFYQTCGNVYRCIVISYLDAFFKNNIVDMQEAVDLAKDSLYHGLLHSDSHRVKFDEYVGYAGSLNMLKKLNNPAIRYVEGNSPTKPALEALIASILRGHGREKVSTILGNFNDFYRGF